MAYFIPLRSLKVGPDFSIPLHRIVIIGSYTSENLKRLVIQHRKAKTLISCTGKLATKSVIILDNGAVVTSPYSVDTINTIINRMQTYDMKENMIRFAKEPKINKDVVEVDIEEMLKKLEEEEIENEIEDDEDGEEGEEESCAEESEDD